MIRKKFGLFCLILLFFPVLAPFGAEITVPRLEMATRGAIEDGEFALSSMAALDIALNGGYKFGILLGLSFEAANLGKAFAYRNFAVEPLPPGATVNADDYNELADRYNNQAVLSFRVAKAMARDLFDLPLELSYFVGITDSFCSGEEFTSRYGANIGTDFTGFYYFPDGIGNNPYRRYDGLHSVQGTGFSFALTKSKNFIPMLYLYQDFPVLYGQGFMSEKIRYSGDFRFLFNQDRLKLEVFSGLTGAKDTNVEIRGGVLAFLDSGKGTEFLLQLGIPGWTQGDEFSVSNLYVLFEPRIHFGYISLYTTLFYHPLIYLHIKEENERNRVDVNLKLLCGDLPESRFKWGFETTLGIKADTINDMNLKLSPFLGFFSNGLEWNFKFRIDPLADNTDKIFDIFAGIKTAY
jgi:hypothetical protein